MASPNTRAMEPQATWPPSPSMDPVPSTAAVSLLSTSRSWRCLPRLRFMNLWDRLKTFWTSQAEPLHLHHGKLGEHAAKRHLQRLGLKLLTANYVSRRGEIDLIFRDHECLVFVEVKTRSSETWTRPATAVDARKQRLLSQTALATFDKSRTRKSACALILSKFSWPRGRSIRFGTCPMRLL